MELIGTLRDNLGSATIWFAVHAGHRGMGTGSALLETAEGAARAARAAGRTTLIGETEWPCGSAELSGVRVRHGYAVGQTNLRSHLKLRSALSLPGTATVSPSCAKEAGRPRVVTPRHTRSRAPRGCRRGSGPTTSPS